MLATGEEREKRSALRADQRPRCRLIPSFSDLAFLLPILVLFWCTTGVGWLLTDSDSGWHIRTGEWILQHGHIPRSDMFSFTKSGEPWIAWEWLSDLTMALAHRLGGLEAVVLLSMLLLGATSLHIYRNTVLASGQRLIAIVLTWLALAASTVHWLARPHLVTPLLTAIFCGVLNEAERSRSAKSLWVLPPITSVWANLHGGFVVGLVLPATYAIGAAVEELLRGRGRNAWIRARKYVCVAAGCVLASFVNPYGYHLHIHVAQYLGTSFYWQQISEFQSIDFHSFSAAYFETLFVLAIAAAAWHLSRARLTHALVLLSWSHLALFSARTIPIFCVIAAPGIGLALCEWIECEPARWSGGWMHGFTTVLAELEADVRFIAGGQGRMHWPLLPSSGLLMFALAVYHPGCLRSLHAEFDTTRFPVSAVTFLSEQPYVSNMRLYSSWQWGGYLIYRVWPRLKVFNDGRTDFYRPLFTEEGLRVWNVDPDWADILAQYHVNAVLVPVDSALAAVLHEKEEWRPMYRDGIAIVFTRIEEQ